MNKEKGLQLLGLAKRAGKLSTGESLTLTAIRKQKAKLVLMASDIGLSTKKKFTNKCTYYQVPLTCEYTTAELSQALGQKRSLVAVCDLGFAKKIQEYLID